MREVSWRSDVPVDPQSRGACLSHRGTTSGLCPSGALPPPHAYAIRAASCLLSQQRRGPSTSQTMKLLAAAYSAEVATSATKAESCGVSCEILRPVGQSLWAACRSHYPPSPRLQRVLLAFIPVACGVLGKGGLTYSLMPGSLEIGQPGRLTESLRLFLSYSQSSSNVIHANSSSWMRLSSPRSPEFPCCNILIPTVPGIDFPTG